MAVNEAAAELLVLQIFLWLQSIPIPGVAITPDPGATMSSINRRRLGMRQVVLHGGLHIDKVHQLAMPIYDTGGRLDIRQRLSTVPRFRTRIRSRVDVPRGLGSDELPLHVLGKRKHGGGRLRAPFQQPALDEGFERRAECRKLDVEPVDVEPRGAFGGALQFKSPTATAMTLDLELVTPGGQVLQVGDVERYVANTVLHVEARGDSVDEDLCCLWESRPTCAVEGNGSIDVPDENSDFGKFNQQLGDFFETSLDANVERLRIQFASADSKIFTMFDVLY